MHVQTQVTRYFRSVLAAVLVHANDLIATEDASPGPE